MTPHDDTDPATQLEHLLRTHDWHYEMSDVHRAWQAGFSQEQTIRKLCEEVDPVVALALWERYAPKGHGSCPV